MVKEHSFAPAPAMAHHHFGGAIRTYSGGSEMKEYQRIIVDHHKAVLQANYVIMDIPVGEIDAFVINDF